MGGGLAGMAAALSLLSRGHPVTLVERRPYLGGRAYSFVDRQTEQQLDNGQHIFLGCCTAYLQFLRDLDVLDKTSFQRTPRVEVRAPGGRRGVISAAPLPPPLHLLPSFLRYPHLTLKERLVAIPALWRIYRGDRRHPTLEKETFYHWLRRHGQSERAVANFWDLLILPTLNDNVRSVSASMGFMVFQEGLMCSRTAACVGMARVGLSALMGDVAAERIRHLGGTLLLGRSVAGIAVDDAMRVSGVALKDDTRLEADWYIAALPFDRLLEVLPDGLRSQQPFAGAAGLTWAPIVNLHLWYDRPVAEFDFAAFVESPVQWVFNKSRIQGDDGPGQYLCLSLSGAWEHWPQPKETICQTFIQALAEALPATREARLQRSLVVKEQMATFRSLPGVAALRPGAETPLENLLLAGDWTDTGWPATMESAVRSGLRAAQVVAQREERR